VGLVFLAWLLERHPELAEAAQAETYRDAIMGILMNGGVGEADFVRFARRLVGLGADVTDELTRVCRQV
jgi:hypothetical protein